jgi:mitochondrial distribution and morphology protein 10
VPEVSRDVSLRGLHANDCSTVSTGIRFTTLPDATPPSFQVPQSTSSPLSIATKGSPSSQAPTTVTALFNPMMGHISSAYTARVSQNLSLSTRFDFNVYSYDSEWAVGAEWWLRRNPTVVVEETTTSTAKPEEQSNEIHGVVKARASTNNVRPHIVSRFVD